MSADELLSEARRLDIAAPAETEELRRVVKAELERRWLEENRKALEGWNRWYEKNGNPLDKYRTW